MFPSGRGVVYDLLHPVKINTPARRVAEVQAHVVVTETVRAVERRVGEVEVEATSQSYLSCHRSVVLSGKGAGMEKC